MLTILIY